jgi:hypothetical protein
MIAIWPAGPPKLIQPSFSQNHNASDSVGLSPAMGVDVTSGTIAHTALRMLATSDTFCLP